MSDKIFLTAWNGRAWEPRQVTAGAEMWDAQFGNVRVHMNAGYGGLSSFVDGNLVSWTSDGQYNRYWGRTLFWSKADYIRHLGGTPL